MRNTILILGSGGVALLLVFSRRARRFVRAGASNIARAEKEHHVWSSAAAVVGVLAAVAAATIFALAWVLRAFINGIQFG